MKKIFLIFILFIPVVTALYGGETWSYYFPFCDKLIVNITGELQIDDGEYLILNNCTENSPNNYICNCSNDYYFNVYFKPNALNNYTFEFNYNYLKEAEEPIPTGGRQGTSSGTFTLRFTNKTRTLMLKQFAFSRFWVNDEQHTIRIIEIGEDWITLEIESEIINLTLNLNEAKEVKIDNETLRLNLKEVRGKVAFIEFTKIEEVKEEPKETKVVEREVEEKINLTEKIDTTEGIVCTTCGGAAVVDTTRKDFIKLMIKIIVILSVAIIGLLGYFIYRKRKSGSNSKRSKKE